MSSGVGKTAIVEGLVQRIKQEQVPDYLKGKTVYQLDMMSLMAGTKFQGELEERLKVIFNFMARPENNVILFLSCHILTQYILLAWYLWGMPVCWLVGSGCIISEIPIPFFKLPYFCSKNSFVLTFSFHLFGLFVGLSIFSTAFVLSMADSSP